MPAAFSEQLKRPTGMTKRLAMPVPALVAIAFIAVLTVFALVVLAQVIPFTTMTKGRSLKYVGNSTGGQIIYPGIVTCKDRCITNNGQAADFVTIHQNE
jgi:hypothetical protein